MERSATSSTQSQKSHQRKQQVLLQDCLKNCEASAAACLECIPHCLTIGSVHASKEHIGLLSLCAQICQASATALAFESEFHMSTCRSCAEICAHCASECASLAGGDEVMLRCADLCRISARSCKEMTAH